MQYVPVDGSGKLITEHGKSATYSASDMCHSPATQISARFFSRPGLYSQRAPYKAQAKNITVRYLQHLSLPSNKKTRQRQLKNSAALTALERALQFVRFFLARVNAKMSDIKVVPLGAQRVMQGSH